MRRSIDHRHLSWPDKTMSALRGQDLDDAEKRLKALPAVGIFDIQDERQTEAIWQTSLDALEGRFAREMHKSEEIRRLVLSRLPLESMLLSPMEGQVVSRFFARQQLEIPVEYGDMLAAETLCRRLWGTVRFRGEEGRLNIAPMVLFSMRMIHLSDTWKEIRQALHRVELLLSSHLSQRGMVAETEALRVMAEGPLGGLEDPEGILMRRWLETAFDYVVDRWGRRIIIHPGLAEAEPLLACGAADAPILERVDEEDMDAEDALCLVDQELYDIGLPLLEGCVRPELYPITVLEDLIILARQGVSEQDMMEALASSLTVIPDGKMADLVHRMVQAIPRWDSLTTRWVM